MSKIMRKRLHPKSMSSSIRLIERFKKWEVKAKDIFYIEEMDKSEAYNFICKYHYLGDAKYSCMRAYGLYMMNKKLVGVATFGRPNGSKSLKGWFGLDNTCIDIFELTRLCMLPILNGTNATSFMLSGSMRLLKSSGARAVITLADSSKHVGSIYQVCNFKYYGKTNKKTDFFPYPLIITSSGNPKYPNKVADAQGVWIPRTIKHRYCFCFDKNLSVNYKEECYPKKSNTIDTECCNGKGFVYDSRFNTYYSCPKCTGKLEIVRNLGGNHGAKRRI